MDSLTQIVLGGAVGEAVLGKKIGNKAILWGAIGGTIPDLDTIPGQFLDTVNRLEIHRGFSHSIIFALLMSPLLGWLVSKIYSKAKHVTIWDWTRLFFWSIFTHPLLDIFTTWGTQFFWPLEWRIALQSIFVIDPLYTIPFLCALVLVMCFKRSSKKRMRINVLGLIISSLYLAWSLLAKYMADQVFEEYLTEQSIDYQQFESRPAPFSTLLWTANIETEDAFYITYYSLLDSNKNLVLRKIKKNHQWLYPFRNHEKIERLVQLTKGYYSVEKTKDGIVLNDLRFGLSRGFMEDMGVFIFRYKIEQTANGLSIEQMPNELGEMRELMPDLIDRTLGIKPS